MKKYKTKKRYIKVIFFIIGIYTCFILLNESKVKISDQKIAKILLETNKIININESQKIKNIIKNIYNKPNVLLPEKMNNNKKVESSIEKEKETEEQPLIYIYNTHQTEEYSSSKFIEYNIKPTVMVADYILEDYFNKNNYKTIVEQESIKEILNNNNWKYSNSYKASRILLEKRKQENPNLKYYIDVHRDSLNKDKTTVEINGNYYAKLLFIIGMENENYQGNLSFTEAINNLLNDKYPNLSKGIYKKSGTGVNGVYNQDFSPYTILIEIGGYENNTTEVMNSTLAFAECFMEVINKYENQNHN